MFKPTRLKSFFYLFVFVFLFVFSAKVVFAQTPAACDGENDVIGLGCVTETGLGMEDPRIIIARVINVALGLLGIIALVIIVFAGFRWMTAAGNEENAKKARQILTAGVMGLVIILAAFSISRFVLTKLQSATGMPGAVYVE